MGREMRKVTPDWQHPYRGMGFGGYSEANKYIPLFEDYQLDYKNFRDREIDKGLEDAIDYFGGKPFKENYMLPDVPIEERTYYMMYENVTEGTPISPAFETPELLAHWLADSNTSSFGKDTASYKQWLPICKGGYAPSMIAIVRSDGSKKIVAGVNEDELVD